MVVVFFVVAIVQEYKKKKKYQQFKNTRNKQAKKTQKIQSQEKSTAFNIRWQKKNSKIKLKRMKENVVYVNNGRVIIVVNI